MRIAKYAFLVLAGASMFFIESAVLTSVLGGMVNAWAIMLFVGGALCLLGVFTDWWLGEFVGIAAIVPVFLMLFLVLTITGATTANPARVTFGLLFASFMLWVTARFMDIWNLAAASKAANREQ